MEHQVAPAVVNPYLKVGNPRGNGAEDVVGFEVGREDVGDVEAGSQDGHLEGVGVLAQCVTRPEYQPEAVDIGWHLEGDVIVAAVVDGLLVVIPHIPLHFLHLPDGAVVGGEDATVGRKIGGKDVYVGRQGMDGFDLNAFGHGT